MDNKKRIKIFSIGLLAFVAIIFGTTYAFFNYTRIGGQSILSTGQIRFNTSGELLIDVERDFPQDADLSGQALTDMKNSHKGELTIQSHTTITNGLAYRIYAVRGDDITGKLRLNDENIKFQLTPNFTSGENGFTVKTNDYENPTNLDFDGEDRILLSTGIVKNTSQLTAVTYNYYMWIDGENTLISSTTKRETLAEGNPSLADTTVGNTTADRYMKNSDVLTQNVTIFPARAQDSGKTVYTTKEFSNGYYNIKIVVEAEDREPIKEPAIVKTIKKDLDTETTINFTNRSSSTNGEGLYILPGTEEEDYPIYYYRGEVDNNNVLFAGFCWQMVRTTETGGIKMIYNGLPDISGSGDNITYNCGTTRDIQDTIRTTTSLTNSSGYFYADDYEIVSTTGNSVTYRLKSRTNPITQVAIADSTAAASNIPTIAANYPYTCKQTTDTATCITLYKVDSYASGTNANVYASTDISVIGKSAFNPQYKSIADIGYMKNARYVFVSGSPTSGAYFGTSVEYGEYDTNNPGTSVYRLVDDGNGSIGTTLDATHHYTCNETTANGMCTEIRYYYYNNGSDYLYITLTGGEKVDDALYKMTGTGTDAVKQRNAGYVLNQNDSQVKTAIESWFRTNLTNEVDSTKRNYVDYLEDTVFCNDRSFKVTTGNTNSSTYLESGWNPNGGNLTKHLHFGTYNRYNNSWYSTTNVPSTSCPNETDRFSVGNNVAHLKYPVGLLTTDEIIMAGAGGNGGNHSSYYIYTGDFYWLLSPSSFLATYANAFTIGIFFGGGYMTISYGLRPVISLKSTVGFEAGGNGTPTNPYVVKLD